MSELGSIFEAEPQRGTKGPDLRVQATVDRARLERGESVAVPVPDQVPFEGSTVPRRLGPEDSPGCVRLHLSPQLGDRAMLRLRGQGGEHPQTGSAGDLYVELTIVRGRASRGWWLWVAVAAAAVVAAWGSHGVWWGG